MGAETHWTGSARLRAALLALACLALLYSLTPGASAQRSASALDISAPQNASYQEWQAAQPALLAKATAALPPRKRNAARVFVVSVAAGGSQALFGREAEAMRDLFARRLGKRAPSVLLSNSAMHENRVPMANRENLAATLAAIGQRFDPASDTALIYLTAHGAPEAWLQTDLPNATMLRAIDARFLAESLDKAGIRRRIVIVSACFSGTWIPPLASPDTIVITASSATRTSFGCDDRRDYTFFGAALLGGPLGQGASWREAYDRLQADIVAEEEKNRFEPSIPMSSVGARMEGVWNAPVGGGR
jgi:hypothetical protein